MSHQYTDFNSLSSDIQAELVVQMFRHIIALAKEQKAMSELDFPAKYKRAASISFNKTQDLFIKYNVNRSALFDRVNSTIAYGYSSNLFNLD